MRNSTRSAASLCAMIAMILCNAGNALADQDLQAFVPASGCAGAPATQAADPEAADNPQAAINALASCDGADLLATTTAPTAAPSLRLTRVALEHADDEVRLAALVSLAELDPMEVGRKVGYQPSDAQVQQFEQTRTQELLVAVHGALDSPNPELRGTALRILQQHASLRPMPLEALGDVARNDPAADRRMSAMELMAADESPRTYEVLEAALADPNPAISRLSQELLEGLLDENDR